MSITHHLAKALKLPKNYKFFSQEQLEKIIKPIAKEKEFNCEIILKKENCFTILLSRYSLYMWPCKIWGEIKIDTYDKNSKIRINNGNDKIGWDFNINFKSNL